MSHRVFAVGALFAGLFASSTALAEDGKSNSDPCPQLVVAPSRSESTKMPLSVQGIVFQQKLISPAGALLSENPTPTLKGPAQTPVTFTSVDAGRPGWVLLTPSAGLLEGTYTVESQVSCSDGTKADRSASINVGPQAALPKEVGSVRIAESFVGAPPNGGKKSFDAVVVYVTPSKELEPYLDVVAWRVTAISPEGTPHASVWLDYGGGSRATPTSEVRLSASAFCPAKGPQKVEVEAAIPGQPTIKTTSSWDVGELVCGQGGTNPPGPATEPQAANDDGCSISRARSGGIASALLVLAASIVVLRRRRGANSESGQKK